MTTPKKRPFSLAAMAGLLTLVALPILGGAASAGALTAPGAAVQVSSRALSASPTSVQFPSITLGDFTIMNVTLTNTGTTTDSVTALTLGGADPADFALVGQDTCTALAAGASCVVQVFFAPNALGVRQATLTPVDGSASPPVIVLTGTGSEGYYEATANGTVFAHGDAQLLGSMPGTKPIVGMAATGDDGGYWLVASDGGIFTFGDAPYFGSTGAIHLNQPIVGMATTPDGGGYWLVASDGGIFTFGDAPFDGSSAGSSTSTFIGMAGDGAPFVPTSSARASFSRGQSRHRPASP